MVCKADGPAAGHTLNFPPASLGPRGGHGRRAGLPVRRAEPRRAGAWWAGPRQEGLGRGGPDRDGQGRGRFACRCAGCPVKTCSQLDSVLRSKQWSNWRSWIRALTCSHKAGGARLREALDHVGRVLLRNTPEEVRTLRRPRRRRCVRPIRRPLAPLHSAPPRERR